MKKYLINGILCMGIFALVSCINTLDTHPTETFDESTVWGSKSTAYAFVYATYEDVLNGLWAGSGTCIDWESRTPNSAQCSQVGEGIDEFATETGISTGSNFGADRFSLLRECNMIIEQAQESTALSDEEREELVAQGRFLRGMVFFDQARKMGRFVPVMQVFSETDDEACMIPMTSSVAESYEYVIADLQAAVNGLPTSSSTGVANKYAAEVILSRAALQAYAYTNNSSYLDTAINAATDVVNNGELTTNYGGMFNENDDTNSEILLGYYRLSTNTTIGSFDELIRCYPNVSADNQRTSLSETPFNNKNGQTFEGWAIYFPTQDLVDQYLVTDEATGEALPWYETSQYLSNVTVMDPESITTVGQVDSYELYHDEGDVGDTRSVPSAQDLTQVNSGYAHFLRYDVLNSDSSRDISTLMYSGRDNRFATSIVYDKCTWVGETIETQLSGNLSQGVRDKEDGGWYNTTTGYYWRKNTIEDPNPRAYNSCSTSFHFVLARVGEAYMNLAEAQLLKGNISAAVEALNATRTTHGGLAASTASTEEEAWTDYMRERRVEMANEGGDIYFSYLRWGKYGGYANYGRAAGDVIYDLDRPVYKIQMDRTRSQVLIGQMTLLNSASRSFTTRRYLLPIYQNFLNTREAYGLDCTQNEGW